MTICRCMTSLAMIVITAIMANAQSNSDMGANLMTLSVNGKQLTVQLAATNAADELYSKLTDGSVSINMSDYGNFEKVGALGFSLPRNDSQLTAQPGDIMLYQGNQMVIFYGTNSWAYTHLGHIEGVTAPELKSILGAGNVAVTLALDTTGVPSMVSDESAPAEYYRIDGTRASETDRGFLLKRQGDKTEKIFKK